MLAEPLQKKRVCATYLQWMPNYIPVLIYVDMLPKNAIFRKKDIYDFVVYGFYEIDVQNE